MIRRVALVSAVSLCMLSPPSASAGNPEFLVFRATDLDADASPDPWYSTWDACRDVWGTNHWSYLDAWSTGPNLPTCRPNSSQPVGSAGQYFVSDSWHNNRSVKDVAALATADPATSILHLEWATARPSLTDNNVVGSVFPGHWLLEAGNTIDVPTDITTSAGLPGLQVTTAADPGLSVGAWVMLVERDSIAPLWTGPWIEHAQVTGVAFDATNSQYVVELTRNSVWTRPSASWQDWTTTTVPPTTLYMAEHEVTWGGAEGRQWTLNVSTSSPADGSGDTGADAFVDMAFEAYRLSNAEGIQFDAAHWNWDGPNKSVYEMQIDVDNDTVADWGRVNGVNQLGLGSAEMLEDLRTLMDGDSRTSGRENWINVDSGDPAWGPRTYTAVDGIEIEHFPSDTSWGNFSSALTHLRQWTEKADHDSDGVPNADSGTRSPWSYGMTKAASDIFPCQSVGSLPDAHQGPPNGHVRLGIAANTLLEMPHAYSSKQSGLGAHIVCYGAYVFDEYSAGGGQYGWLGDLQSVTRDTSDLGSAFSTGSWTWTSAAHATSTGYATSLTIAGGTYTFDVSAVPTTTFAASSTLVFPSVVGAYFKGDVVSTTDSGGKYVASSDDEFTVSFSATGTTTAPAYASFTVPRSLRVKVTVWQDCPSSGSSTGDGKAYKTEGSGEFDMSQDVLVGPVSEDFSLSFRGADFGSTCQLGIKRVQFASGEDVGVLTVSNLVVSPGGADRLVGEFDNGAVIVNMTETPWVADLAAMGSPMHRLNGLQDPSVNDGMAGAGSAQARFTVDARDALFVRKTLWSVANSTAVDDEWWAAPFPGSLPGGVCPPGEVVLGWKLRSPGPGMSASSVRCRALQPDASYGPVHWENHFAAGGGGTVGVAQSGGVVPVGVHLTLAGDSVIDTALVLTSAATSSPLTDIHAVGPTATTYGTAAFGGAVGTSRDLQCQPGRVLTGLEISVTPISAGVRNIDGVRLHCSDLLRNDRVWQ